MYHCATLKHQYIFEETSAVQEKFTSCCLLHQNLSLWNIANLSFQWHRFKQVWTNLSCGLHYMQFFWAHVASQHSNNVTDIASVTCRFYWWHIKCYIGLLDFATSMMCNIICSTLHSVNTSTISCPNTRAKIDTKLSQSWEESIHKALVTSVINKKGPFNT